MFELYRLFNKEGIDKGWMFSLTFGESKYYNNNRELLSYFIEDSILYINAISIDDEKFSIKLLKDILTLVKQHQSVVLTTTVQLSKHILRRYNVVQIDNTYYKGVLDGK